MSCSGPVENKTHEKLEYVCQRLCTVYIYNFYPLVDRIRDYAAWLKNRTPGPAAEFSQKFMRQLVDIHGNLELRKYSDLLNIMLI